MQEPESHFPARLGRDKNDWLGGRFGAQEPVRGHQQPPFLTSPQPGSDKTQHSEDGALSLRKAGHIPEELRDETPQGLDPLARALMPPLSTPTVHNAPLPPAAIDQMAHQLIRRFSLGGTARGSSVRLEFGEGDLAGSSVVVTSEQGELSITVDAPAGVDAESLAERIRGRLAARGLHVTALECS